MRILMAMALGLVCITASAVSVTDIGETTRQVLAKQHEGRHSVEVKPMLEDVAERVYKRFLKSFDDPVPADFEEGGFSSSN